MAFDPCCFRWPWVTLRIGTRGQNFRANVAICSHDLTKFVMWAHVGRVFIELTTPPSQEGRATPSPKFLEPLHAHTLWPRKTKIRRDNTRGKGRVLRSRLLSLRGGPSVPEYLRPPTCKLCMVIKLYTLFISKNAPTLSSCRTFKNRLHFDSSDEMTCSVAGFTQQTVDLRRKQLRERDKAKWRHFEHKVNLFSFQKLFSEPPRREGGKGKRRKGEE